MKSNGLLVMLAALGIGVVSFAGCGDDGNNTTTGTGGSTSSSSGTTTSTSSSSTTASSTSSSGGVANSIAAPCQADGDCYAGEICLTPTTVVPALGGSPAGGYCSKECQTDADCPGDGSACLAIDQDGTNRCFLGCTQGPDLMYLNDPLDPAKCYGREDLGCQPLQNGGTVCLPLCGNDSQCPAGNFCDLGSGTCVADQPTGIPMGQYCDTTAMTDQCQGVCIGIQGFPMNVGMCSGLCVMGGDIINAPDCGGIDKGLCLYSQQGVGLGDGAFCAGACTKQSECGNPDLWCFDLFKGQIPGVTNGYCLGADACPNGDADCAMSLSKKCVTTQAGPFCLDEKFPVDTGTGGAGGMGTGGAGGMGTGGAGGMGTGGMGTGGAGGSMGTGGAGGVP